MFSVHIDAVLNSLSICPVKDYLQTKPATSV